jgi:hypothetical protein
MGRGRSSKHPLAARRWLIEAIDSRRRFHGLFAGNENGFIGAFNRFAVARA